MDSAILADKDLFLERVVDKLGSAKLNFTAQHHLISKSVRSSAPLQAAGVILLLFHRSGQLYFRLSKRSNGIPQAGDLSCPGGILQQRWDGMVMKLVTSGIIPTLKNRAGALSRQRDRETFQFISLFLANALREAWEEIRLNPFSVLFLGPLPAYSLQLYQRIIFPLVGLVPEITHFRPNSEVESLVDIPITAFFQQQNYAALIREIDTRLGRAETKTLSLPCLIYRDQRGKEHVLWGATFFVIVSFLEITCNFDLPEWRNSRAVKKTIDARYLSGKR